MPSTQATTCPSPAPLPDTHTDIADLRQKGITFQLQDDNQIRLAFFSDPDGNALYLVQSKW